MIHDFDPNSDAYTEKNGRKLPVDIAFAEVDPSEYVALVIPGGRAPEYIRLDADVRRITEYFFEKDLPVGTICHGPQVPAVYGLLKGRKTAAFPPLHGDMENAGADHRRRSGRRRREHGLLPWLAGHAGVVARVHERARTRRRPGVAAKSMVPVLLLHGSGPGTTAAAWNPLVDAFGERFRVIAPDLPGFGASKGQAA